MLIIPGSHAQTHLFNLVFARKLPSRVILKTFIDVLPSRKVKVKLRPYIREVGSQISKYSRLYANIMDILIMM
jgi:hypothetical protein